MITKLTIFKASLVYTKNNDLLDATTLKEREPTYIVEWMKPKYLYNPTI